ncbi:hypothetical protein [Dactylosporangium sp. NPDC049140]
MTSVPGLVRGNAQGYHFARPLRPADVELLRHGDGAAWPSLSTPAAAG